MHIKVNDAERAKNIQEHCPPAGALARCLTLRRVSARVAVGVRLATHSARSHFRSISVLVVLALRAESPPNSRSNMACHKGALYTLQLYSRGDGRPPLRSGSGLWDWLGSGLCALASGCVLGRLWRARARPAVRARCARATNRNGDERTISTRSLKEQRAGRAHHTATAGCVSSRAHSTMSGRRPADYRET